MERLTWKHDLDGYTDVRLRYGVSVGDAICHLADYEGTGLEPEEVKEFLEDVESRFVLWINKRYGIPATKFMDIMQAEKDGRMVVLPCKVGDVLWTNSTMSGWHLRAKDKPYSAKVVFIGLNNSDEMGRGLINVAYEKHNYMMQFSFSDIGKSVFLTREAAQAALKKREETP